jgi:hypothetical protein
VEVKVDRLVDTAVKLSELEGGIRRILGVFEKL